ncbi:uncharacterized protein [Physcomitrium patens]|uniref:uncharacterized protein isoform X1 n=2 Tax=Physcomitrium patens TaxID=3218 RepID=UPI000D171B65|nr:ankyrin repeat and SAM domain-containing protein 6-like isoform X1 [Physcomitrium patens]|eukprot:XP_024376722.1 ankyrin repeat and SAM domain-containing protein 6-like isoform X1 [Physcomitrella patens]
MSHPRVTVTLGRGGKRVERHVTVPTEMYADRTTGDWNRRRSIRERLGVWMEPVRAAPQSTGAKRHRDVEGQWKHDMFFDESNHGSRGQQTLAGRTGGPDLRSKLARQGSRNGNQGNAGNVVDLRDKLSGLVSHQATHVHESPKVQRRVASVVFNGTSATQGAASTAVPAPVSARSVATVKRPVDGKVPNTEEQTVRTFLHSLGLEKYVATFQSEEIDMAALGHMSDNDLKELGVPMGPRKKILLAIRGKE